MLRVRMHANRTWGVKRRVRLRPVSGVRGEAGGVFPGGAGASRALVMVQEAAECRRDKVCLGRFILRHVVAATSSSLSFSACLPIRSASNCWIVSDALGWTEEQSGGCLEAQGPGNHRCEAHRREAML